MKALLDFLKWVWPGLVLVAITLFLLPPVFLAFKWWAEVWFP